jgi:hypothetical protein
MFKNFYTASPNAMKTKLMHPSSSRAFHRDQERDLKHPSSVDLIRAFHRDQERDLKHPSSVDLISTNKTKQTNYLVS